ncbi:hypothetical protein NW762_002493 [Fusarium torreyae]|uniref:Nephrocystin 3-like N-terminal domain-containing protein n=1 Tax=Fusarium torreyae TaxID=1237075 RepID=A0A9W8VM46_9HYPO|nr:hypothetical protein NW762_002493 [Fusarium torreyae]
MYRSLLLQLFEGFPDLQQVLDDNYLVPRNHSACPSLNALKDLFRTAVSLLGNRSCTCFVDALDECDEQQVMDMVDFFEELSEQCTRMDINLRFCFSSRHYPYIDIRSGIRLLLENQVGHTEDLESYIDSHLRIGSPALTQELKPTILKKAAGIFLWVALVVQILNRKSRRGGPASGLSELFKDLLLRDQGDTSELLLSILWILFAQRPLNPVEYYHALWFELSPEDLPGLRMLKNDTLDASGRLNRFVISSSKGLAEITKAEQPTVQFVHESVRDFLIKDKDLHELWLELGGDWESRGHERLKSCCNAYIDHQIAKVSSQPYHTILTYERYILNDPFLEYATLFLLNHANATADTICQRQFLNEFHVSKWIRLFNYFEKSPVRRCSQRADIIYILADMGLPNLIRTRRRENPNIDIPGGRLGYPLLAAMAKAKKDSVIALLGLSSSVYDGTDITASLTANLSIVGDHHTPFSWACENGLLSIARILFQRATYITALEVHVSLFGAFENHRSEVVRWLIHKGADTETKDENGRTLLSLAAEHGDGDTILLLLSKAADIETKDSSSHTPLFWAAKKKNEATAQLLLDKGADVKPDETGQILLSLFAASGRTDTMRLLIDKGVDVKTGDKFGQMPLLIAAQRGDVAMVQPLLEEGADIRMIGDKEGCTALTRAVHAGDKAMVQLLLENGADIEAKTDEGDLTPLALAVREGNECMVQPLIKRGADIKTQDECGFSLPQQAAERGHQAMEQLLYTEARHQGYEYPSTVDE